MHHLTFDGVNCAFSGDIAQPTSKLYYGTQDEQ